MHRMGFYLTLEECKSWLTGVKGDTGASFYLTLEECKLYGFKP